MGYSKLKGTYDIIPLESDFYLHISRTVEKILENYGYKNIAFPVIEYADLFARGAVDSSDIVVKKEMYVFEDRGKRIIALRPEGTASAVRLYIENGLSMQGYSARMYYNGPMFRAENPQAGRYRQFVQYGAEYIGDGRPEADVELISMNNDFFNALGIKDVTIFVNSIGCRVCRPAYQEDLRN
ncbi:MAG: ATP phosphoribosyltransferase regulatory subunit, partial [Brevinematales bacterium]